MRINLYAGPGAGKSTTATAMFSRLKVAGYSVELVSEYVKAWAIAKREIVGFDQVYLMGKQLNYEYRFISNGVQNVITDSPVLLAACYARAYHPQLRKVADHMEAIVDEYEAQNPGINIFLDRGRRYDTRGRYQSKSEAVKLDGLIEDTLQNLGRDYAKIDFEDADAIYKYIISRLDPPN